VKKLLFYILIFFAALPLPSLAQQVVNDSSRQGSANQEISEDVLQSSVPKLETGSVNPMHGGPGIYTFQTILVAPKGTKPDYVKIFLQKGDGKSVFEGLLMTKGVEGSRGIIYEYSKSFTEKDEGTYEFYFEAKFGNKTIHGPSYGGEDCTPGMCGTCCGGWSGPKIISSKLIEENGIYLFRKGEKEPVWYFPVGKNWVTSTAFSLDDQHFASADNNQNIYFFDIAHSEPEWIYTGSTKETGELGADKGLVAFADNGYLAASLKGVVYLFNSGSSTPNWSYPTGMVLNGLVISEDGKYIAAAGRDTNVYLWNTDSSTPAWSHKIEAKGGLLGGSVIISLTMSPDGKYFAAGTSCPDRSIHVFTPSKPDEIFQAKAGINFPVGTVSISNNGQYLLAGGGGDPEDPYTAILYKVGSSEPVWHFDFSRNPVSEVAISPDAKSCVIGSNMDGLMFNDCSGKNPVWKLEGTGHISSVAFSKDGNVIASGSLTNHVFLLPKDGSKIINDWKINNKIESLDISSDGSYIAVGTGLNRFFMTGAVGENTSGAGGSEVKERTIKIVKVGSVQNTTSSLATTNQGNNLAPLIRLLSFSLLLISCLILGGYILTVKLNLLKKGGIERPKPNKTILIVLSTLSAIFLIINIYLAVSNYYLSRKNTPSRFTEQENIINEASPSETVIMNSEGTYQEGENGICGNHVCEGAKGENGQSCPRDCSEL